MHQKATGAHEPPSPKHPRNAKQLGPVFTFSPEHKKTFDANRQKMAKIRRRWHSAQLQQEGVNRDGSVWWYAIFLKNYCAWYQKNQEVAQLTIGEIMLAKRQERDRAALLAQAGLDFENTRDPESKTQDSEYGGRGLRSSLDSAPENLQDKQQNHTPEHHSSSLWLECLRALLTGFFSQKV
jgi:hypothetical protein